MRLLLYISFFFLIQSSCEKSDNTTWREINIVELNSSGVTLTSISFHNEKNGIFSAAERGYSNIYSTTDGGETWIQQESGTSSFLRDVVYINENYIFAVGSGGTILFSKTGGIDWNEQDSGVNQNLSAVDFIDQKNGFTAGANGTILQTQDGGKNWRSLDGYTNHGLLDINFNNDTGYAVGFGGTILKTVDGGANWQQYLSSTDNTLRSVQIPDSNKVIMVGDKGTILLK